MHPKRSTWWVLAAAAAVAVAYSLWRVAGAPVAQPEAGGLAQKIFYYHVGSALTMYLAFLVGGVASVLYLRRQQRNWDLVAAANLEVGLVFCTLVLITGPLWARPVWGTWWRWEPRLVTFLILWLSFVVYFLFRRSIAAERVRARLAAVYAILACLNIPLVVLSTRLWRPEQQLHPRRVGLPPTMLWTLLWSVAALALVYVLLAGLRYRVAWLEARRAERVAEEETP